ncbi:MAG TPA: DUF4112 domain-containing protein [Polyangiaceae bacterium]|jgi:hypothetical protein|nr:DUF4112 domain-containing protein [Polyangiaceae bacterium]
MQPEWEPNRQREPEAQPEAGPEIPAWALTLVRLLDDAVFIPGTRIGVGLDAVLGFLLPTLGDAATGVASLALLVLGFQMRVPKVVLLRMMFNILLDTLLGAVPIAGDLFDLFWRSNRRNLALLQRYDRNPERKPSVADYLIVGLCVTLVLAAIAVPIVVGFALLRWLWHALSG